MASACPWQVVCLPAFFPPSLFAKKKIAQRNPFPHPTTRPGALGLAGCLEARSKKQHPSCSDERESPKTQPLPFSSPFLSHGGSRFAVVFGDVMQKISFAPSSISHSTFPPNECNSVCKQVSQLHRKEEIFCIFSRLRLPPKNMFLLAKGRRGDLAQREGLSLLLLLFLRREAWGGLPFRLIAQDC